MRAISTFTFDRGISTVSCSAPCALRMRASMSAMGSVIDMAGLPARLGDAGHLAAVGELPEAEAAQREFAEVGPRAAAPLAAGIAPDLELRRPACLDDECLF